MLVTAAAILLAVVYAVAWSAPSVGLYHDDGIYLVTAKALAEGKGYRIISLPGEMPQTKYPFLFPAALSVLWRLFPDFPGNVPLLKVLPLACALVWFALTYKLLIRLQATRVQASWVVLLTAASPLVIFCSTSLMSETMFAALFAATLLVADKVEHSQSDRLAWAVGALAALAFLTRSAGIAILVAIPIAFAVRRRFGAIWRFSIVGGAFAGLWPLWVRTQTAAIPPAELYYSSANYSSWNIIANYEVAEKVRILFTNVLLSLASPGMMLGLPPSLWLVLPVLVLLIVLLARKLVRGGAVHLSVALYCAMILCWAWPPPRFIAVILPIVLLFMWRAVEAITPSRALRYSALALIALLSCFSLAHDIQLVARTVLRGQVPINENAAKWSELERVFSWLRTNTEEDAIVLANLDPAFFLYTGRKSTRSFVADSYKLFYSPGAPTDDSAASLHEIITRTGASFLVMTPDRWFSEMPVYERRLVRYMDRHPEKLELVDRPGSDPEYRIYRIRH